MMTTPRCMLAILASLLISQACLAAKPKLVPAPPPPVLLDEPLKGDSSMPPAVTTSSPSRGQLLYENHCTACHESQVHIREKRLAENFSSLRALAIRWSSYQNLRWSAEDIEEVARFLNDRYYHFNQTE